MTDQRPSNEEPKVTAAMIAEALIDAIKRLRARIAAAAKGEPNSDTTEDKS